MCTYIYLDAVRGQKISSDSPELEFQAVMCYKMSVLRTKVLSSRRTVNALDAEPSLLYFFHKIFSCMIQYLSVTPTRIET